MNNPYANFTQKSMILRDHLAHDRTILACERTVLAYLRTAVALAAGGLTMLKLFPKSVISMWTGYILLGLGGATLVFGFWRLFAVRKKMAHIQTDPPDEEEEN